MALDWERVAGPMGYTEGPVWDGEAVLFTDIPNSQVMRYDPANDRCSVHVDGTNNAVGMKVGPDGALYMCEKTTHSIGRYDPDGGSERLVDEYRSTRLNSPNDLCFDSTGRIWFSDPNYSKIADHSPDITDQLELGHMSVYRLDPVDEDYEITRVTEDTTKPNGVQVSPEEDALYVAQSHYGEGNERELRSYPIHDDGSLGDYEVLHNFYPHRGIDGMCLDREGNIVAAAGWEDSGPGPMIYVFAPTGRVLETWPMPARPSNCTFGDADRRTLYVTGEGCLWRARTDRVGFVEALDRFEN